MPGIWSAQQVGVILVLLPKFEKMINNLRKDIYGGYNVAPADLLIEAERLEKAARLPANKNADPYPYQSRTRVALALEQRGTELC